MTAWENTSLWLALLLPLLQGFTQFVIFMFSSSQRRVYSILVRSNSLFSFCSLFVTLVVLKSFYNYVAKGEEWVLFFDFFGVPLRFFITGLSVFFWCVKNILVFLAEWFGIKYFFREHGIVKFYFMATLFSFSLNLVFFSDSFAPFCLGWELMGICSVVLIAFFDYRLASVERSYVALLFYKLGDFFLLAALLYIANTTSVSSFSLFKEYARFGGSSSILVLFALAAFVKSGLLPFSIWLPRSMEGPTPSSALFYGALSSHAGAFLLLKISSDFTGFEGIPFYLIFWTGILTAFFAYFMAITRTDVKNQIIYSVLGQLSIIFIEISFGWIKLATIHCVLHMFLRFFQFLIAPSAIYLAHKKDFLWHKPLKLLGIPVFFQQRLAKLIWWLSLHEFGLVIFWRRFVLFPFFFFGQIFSGFKKNVLSPISSMNPKIKDMVRSFLFLVIISIPVISKSYAVVSLFLVIFFQLIALGFSLMCVQEKRISSSFFNLIYSEAFLVISYYYAINPKHMHLFYSHLVFTTLVFSCLIGLFIFFRNIFNLQDHHHYIGLHRVSPFISTIFAILILIIIGFPGFSTYFSFELMSEDLSQLSALAAISGLALFTLDAYLWFNIYTKLFWGVVLEEDL